MSQPAQLASNEEKIAILEAALSDAQENLKFAESKAGFTAVVLTAAITAIPAIPNLKEFIGVNAVRNSLQNVFLNRSSDIQPFNAILNLLSQASLIIAIGFSVLAIYLAIKVLIPILNARDYVDLDCGPGDDPCHPNLFYPSGFSKRLTLRDAVLSPNSNSKFLFTASQQRSILKTITRDSVVSTLGEQIIILGAIRDIKMKRVYYSLKFILFSLRFLVLSIVILTFKFIIYGGN